MANITGTNDGETLTGTSDADVIEGLGGDDTIYGMGAADTMVGGQGNDTMFVDNAGDVVTELDGEGNDVVAASLSWTLTAGAYVELMTTGWIDGTTIINLTGNERAQQIWGNAAANTLSGGNGDDVLLGFAGNDSLVGGDGNDTMFGGAGTDTLTGGLGNDTYFIDDLGDHIVEASGQGYDVVAVGFDFQVTGSIELLTTGWIGGTAAINLTGNSTGNEIWGNDGDNRLDGGSGGNDALFGFGGNDHLEGGQGYDILAGGTGQDIFFFGEQASNGIEADTIVDFSSADDTIQMDHTHYVNLPEAATPLTGVLKAECFVLGTAALDSDDRIIYDAGTGRLIYDPDGSGSSVGFVFAVVTPGITMTAADFVIV